MPTKRTRKTVEEEPAPAPVPAQKKAKEASKPAAKAVKPAAKAEAKPVAKPAAKAMKGSKATAADPKAFVSACLEVCKVLMSVCETEEVEDAAALTVTSTTDFKTYGEGILNLLPEEARLPMMKLAL